MRTLAVVTASALLLTLSGCQHVHLMKQKTDHTTSTADNVDHSTPATAQQHRNPLTQLWSRHFSQSSIQDYPAACLAESKLNQPIVVGQVIDTPRYAMITLAKQQQQAQVMGGELCIINKVNHHIEITAIDDLRFVRPINNPLTTEPAP